jgi:universal stress protein E
MVSKPGRIIVGMDPHAIPMAAVALGERLAEGMDATLEVFMPVYNSQVSLAHFENREHLQHARDSLVRRHLEHLEERLASAGIGERAERHAAWDHPHEEALIRRVLERAADLLIVELPAGAASGGRPLSAAQWQLVRHCPSPVLLTRGGAWREAPVVVAAVDPGGRHGRADELDTRILKFAERVALGAGGTVHAFHAWERTLRALIGNREEVLVPDRPETGTERRHREAVYSVLAAAEVAPARVSLVEGRAEQVLPEYCREAGADVVVMGAIARNPFGRIFIGSTAERVLEQLPCDLLVVKPGAFRTPVSSERWPAEQAATPILGVPGI